MSQDTTTAAQATTDPSLFSPGAKGASWLGQGTGGDTETLYDLQGLVSHSGTLHGVSLCFLFCFVFSSLFLILLGCIGGITGALHRICSGSRSASEWETGKETVDQVCCFVYVRAILAILHLFRV